MEHKSMKNNMLKTTLSHQSAQNKWRDSNPLHRNPLEVKRNPTDGWNPWIGREDKISFTVVAIVSVHNYVCPFAFQITGSCLRLVSWSHVTSSGWGGASESEMCPFWARELIVLSRPSRVLLPAAVISCLWGGGWSLGDYSDQRPLYFHTGIGWLKPLGILGLFVTLA